MMLINQNAEKRKNIITGLERFVFPVLLVLYPLIKINQGIDITDTTYSLGNFRYFEQMDGMWVVATYLANLLGFLLMKLPFGSTMLGMNLYTGLLVSAVVLLVYVGLGRQIPKWILFLGEIIAIGFCWCPTAILYNYLTYLLFTAGGLFLYKAITEEKRRFYLLAGFFLGMNVMVRFPNILEAGLILGLWYYGWITHRNIGQVVKETFLCLAGYLVGFGILFLTIYLQYGSGAYGEMLQSLFAIQNTDASYSPFAMISDSFSAYASSFKWFFLIVIAGFFGSVFFFLIRNWGKKWKNLGKSLYILGLILMIRMFWGRGMFNFHYYEYPSMFEWGMMLLYFALAGICFQLYQKKSTPDEKLLALLMGLIILIAPLGSNNYTYQNLNNLFLVAPITLWIYVRIGMKRKNKSEETQLLQFPWWAISSVILIMILIQSLGFGTNFVFRGGESGVARTAKVENSTVLFGMHTDPERAIHLSELLSFCQSEEMIGEQVIIFGDAPGLSYILEMPSALSNSWADLDSYSYDQMEEELMEFTNPPSIILHKSEPATALASEKKDLLLDYLVSHHYTKKFDNGSYQVYRF